MRGYWNTPQDLSKENVLDWFSKQTQTMGFPSLKDALYFQQAAGINFVFLLLQMKKKKKSPNDYICLCHKLLEQFMFMATVEGD